MALSILDGTQTATTLSTILSSGQHITAHTVVSLGTQAITDMRSAVSGSVVSVSSLPAISGTVTANLNSQIYGETTNRYAIRSAVAYNNGGDIVDVADTNPFPVFITDNTGVNYGTTGTPLKISGSVTIGAGTQQIGSVTANLAISSSAISSGSFASLSSATLVPANTARKMATIYNLGAGQLFINAGASATTLGGGFMVALSGGDFYECDYTTTTLSAIFATAGTASWVSH